MKSRDLVAQGEHTTDLDQLLGLPAAASSDELLELGVQALNSSGMWMLRAGRCFQRLCDPISKRLDIGVVKVLEQRGVSHQHARNAINYSEYIGSLPEIEARRMLKVPYTKVLAIADADPQVVEELLEEGALDGKQPLSVRDLRDRVAKEEQSRHRADARAETAEATVEYLKRELEGRAQTSKTPPWLIAARMEFAALTESMSLSVEDLHKVLVEHVLPAPHKTEEQKFHTRSAAGMLYHSLAGVMANAQMLLLELVDQFGKEIAGHKDLAILSLDGHELQRLAVIRAQLIRQNEADRQTRALLRAAGQPRGRGRPKGAKNKKAGR